MATFALKRDKNGAAAMSGVIDENADLEPALAPSDGPIVLNFRGLLGINSQGVAKYLDFIGLWEGRKVVYEDCPAPLVEAFMMLPALLGPEDNTAEIRSLAVPYRCGKCQDAFSIIVRASDLRGSATALVFPARVCPRCNTALNTEPLADDYALLAAQGALRVPAR